MASRTFLAAVATLVLSAAIAPAQFTAGQVVVLRIGGDGAYNPGGAALTSNGTAGFIDQFHPATAGQTAPTLTVSLPTVTGGGVNRITFHGSHVETGYMTRSWDGQSVVVPGYDSALGQATSSSSNNRIIAQVGYAATVSTPVITNTYSGGRFHSAATNTGANFWAAGSISGTYAFVPNGSQQPGALVQNAIASTRVTGIYTTTGGQRTGTNLYFSTIGETRGIYVFNGTPTSAASPTRLISTGATSEPFAFAISPGGTTVYVADGRAAASGGGIQRWDFVSSTWGLTYTLSVGNSAGARGLAVDFSGPNPVLFATTTELDANRLITITDTGAASSFSTLATAPANTVFRGVAQSPAPIPEPATGLAIAAGFLGLAGISHRTRRRKIVDDQPDDSSDTLHPRSPAGTVDS